MGNSQSPAADPRFVSTARAFTQTELDDLKSLFVSLAGTIAKRRSIHFSLCFPGYFLTSKISVCSVWLPRKPRRGG
ncbi:hypothetical protein CK203_114978 [Vitis vinifera]|uniref:Uncharacterized protein n=1 Tax=Vitis vinifera TaxID=29760 RepID=A0A438BP26_VITVI|nr:hypothetical protein CK203_114978 [Vitis vinifera]